MTPEHAQKRCGNVTASQFKCVIAGGEGKTRGAYLRRIVAEILTKKPAESFRGNADTERGNEQEPMGIDEYEARTENLVMPSDFIKHHTLRAGCSPDGLIDLDGGYEGKSVIPTVQVETIIRGKYPTEHKAQIQGNLWITERAWWEFSSYSPDMPEPHNLYIFRVERDEEYIAMLAREVTRFLDDVDRMVDLVLGRDRTEDLLRASLVKVAA